MNRTQRICAAAALATGIPFLLISAKKPGDDTSNPL